MTHAASTQSQAREKIPLFLLRAMAALVLSSLVVVTYARVTGRPLEAVPATGAIAAERMIRVEGDLSGAARVLDADGTVIADFAAGKGGFVAGVWRAIAFKRHQTGADPDATVRLVRFQAGGLMLIDELTGERLELIGFGPDNAAAFARLLD